jgi:hypothetical protein
MGKEERNAKSVLKEKLERTRPLARPRPRMKAQ